MTTYNHTQIATGAAANASTVNAPLGQLDASIGDKSSLSVTNLSIVSAIGTAALTTSATDTLVNAINTLGDVSALGAGVNPNTATMVTFVGTAALRTTQQKMVPAINELLDDYTAVSAEITAARGVYADLDTRLDNIAIAGGNIATLANGAANAGQKVITVDSTTGWLAGAPFVYTLVGGAVETNTVGTVDGPTQITATVNIGTGGIANDTFLMVIPPGMMLASGATTGATDTAQIFEDGLRIGTNTASANESAVILRRLVSAANVDFEGYRDESSITSTVTGKYNSFDAAPTISGSLAYDHYHAFQARPTYNSSSAITRMVSLWSQPDMDGNATNLYHIYIEDPTGSGTITTQAGIRIDALTQAGTNYSLLAYGAGVTLYNEGPITSSGRITTLGSIDATVSMGIGLEPTGIAMLEISKAAATGTLASGISNVFTYTGTATANNFLGVTTVENGQTSGSNIVYGSNVQAGLTATAANSYAAAVYGASYLTIFTAATGKTAETSSANALRVEVPTISGTGTITIGENVGLAIANQGTAKATTAYGIKVSAQTGSGTNYGLYVEGGNVVFNGASGSASDFTVNSDTYTALLVDASDDSVAVMNSTAGKVGFFGTAPIARPLLATGAGATVDNVITVLQNLGLVKQS